MKKYAHLLLIFTTIFSFANAENPEDLVDITFVAHTEQLAVGQAFSFDLKLDIAKHWHINSNVPLDEFVIPTELVLNKNDDISSISISYPEATIVNLAALGGKTSTFENTVMVKVSGRLSENYSGEKLVISGFVRYQGCNDQVCLAPVDKSFSHKYPVVATMEEVKTFVKSENVNNNESELTSFETETDNDDITKSIAEKGFLLTLFIVFLGGLALNLTPCVYPLIPITVSYFSSQGKKGSGILMASLYVLGIAITYSVLGTFAAMTGDMFGTALTNPIVLIIIAGIMLFLSLSMFGVYEFRVPMFLMQLGGGSRSGAVGSLIMGLTMGIVAAPCVGPFVIGLLTYVAKTGSPFIGFIMFFTLSLGLGLPYLFLGIFSTKIGDLPRSGEWLNGVRIFFGLVLVGMALYFINPLLPNKISEFILPLYMIAAGFYYTVIDSSGSKSPGFFKGKLTIGIIIMMIGVWWIKPAPESLEELHWADYNQTELIKADELDEEVIIDFFADWCLPCKELDKLTFSDPAVQAKMKNYRLLKVDLTQDKSAISQELKEKYAIKGVPTIIFLDKDGNEILDLRLTGFEKSEKFIKRLK